MDANFNFPMVYDPSGRLLAVLGNADGIGYVLQHNDLSTASFTLPAGDPGRAHCQPGNLVRLSGDGGGTGMYRIAGQEGEETAQGGEITYTLEHAAAALLDDVLPGGHDLTGMPLTEAIRYILDRQTVKKWVLGRVEPEGTATLKCENTPLLTALLQLGQGIPEEYTWEFDCGNHTAGPWTLNLLRAAETPGCGIHYGRSLTGIRKTVDASALITRLYAYGAGTGEERTDLRPVNGGAPCIDADTAGTWGVRCGVLTDTGISDPAALMEKARRALEQYKNPYVTYTATAVDLAAMTGDPWDTYRPGKMVRVTDEEHGVAFASRIVTVKKTDVWDPASLEITIANAPRDTLDSMTEMQTQADALNEQQNRTQTLAAGTQKTVTEIQETLHLMAGKIDENTGNLEGVSVLLDGIGKEIELQAGTISAQGALIEGAQLAIDGANARIDAEAKRIDEANGEITSAKLAIDGANAAITAEVKRASEAEGELTGKLEVTTEAITAEVTRATGVEEELAGRIKITEDSITEQAGKIDAQGELISGAEERINGLDKSIEDIAGDIDSVTGDLTGVRTRLDGAEKKITEQAGTLDAQGKLISGAEERIDGLNKTITDVAGDVDTLTGNLSGVRTELDGINKTITQQAGQITAQGELIDGAQRQIDGINDKITDFATHTEVTDLGTTVNTVSETLDAVKGEVETKVSQETFDALGERVGTAETKITQNADAIELRATKKELDEVSASLKVESDKITSVVGDVGSINGTLEGWGPWISGIETNVISQRDAIQGALKDIDTHNTLIYQNRDAIALCATKEGMAAAIKVEADRITSVVGDVSSLSETTDTLATNLAGVGRDLYGYEDEEGVHHGGIQEGLWNAQTEITQTKEAITLKANADVVDTLTGRVEKAEADIVVNANGITQTVKKGELISQINQSAETVQISASKVNLVGYVTTDYLESKYITAEQVNADISEYVETWADDATFGTLSVVNGNITSLSCTDITIGGNGFPTAVNDSIFSRPHYHTVSESGGTVTIGGPATSPGTFNIADTKFYQDGVSAAINSVTLEDPVWRESAVYTNQAITVSASNGNSKTAYVYLTQGNWSNGSKKVYMRSDSSSGTIRAQISVDAPSVSYTWDDNAKNNAKGTVTVGITINGTHYTRTYPIYASWV